MGTWRRNVEILHDGSKEVPDYQVGTEVNAA